MEFSTTSNPLTSSQLPSGGLLAAAAPTPMRMSMEDDARTPLERLAATSLKTEEELVAMSDEDLLLLMHEANLGVVAKNKAMETVTELRNKAAADAAGDDEPPPPDGAGAQNEGRAQRRQRRAARQLEQRMTDHEARMRWARCPKDHITRWLSFLVASVLMVSVYQEGADHFLLATALTDLELFNWAVSQPQRPARLSFHGPTTWSAPTITKTWSNLTAHHGVALDMRLWALGACGMCEGEPPQVIVQLDGQSFETDGRGKRLARRTNYYVGASDDDRLNEEAAASAFHFEFSGHAEQLPSPGPETHSAAFAEVRLQQRHSSDSLTLMVSALPSEDGEGYYDAVHGMGFQQLMVEAVQLSVAVCAPPPLEPPIPALGRAPRDTPAGRAAARQEAAAVLSAATANLSFAVGQGDGTGDEFVGQARSAEDCARLVARMRPAADGATFSAPGTGLSGCWAEYGMLDRRDDPGSDKFVSSFLGGRVGTFEFLDTFSSHGSGTDTLGWTAAEQTDGGGNSTLQLSVTRCGSLGSLLGGFRVLGSGAWLLKTYDLSGHPHSAVELSMEFVKVDSWDDEEAVVEVDGQVVWRRTFSVEEGQRRCGNPNSGWKDRAVAVGPMQLEHTAARLRLRVGTTLDQDASDESFGIQNVLLRGFPPVVPKWVAAATPDAKHVCRDAVGSSRPASWPWRLLARQSAGNYRPARDWVRWGFADGGNGDFSILSELESCRGDDDKFQLKLVWPEDSYLLPQEWKQTTNPVTAAGGGVDGYEAVEVNYYGRKWGGLERSQSDEALLDGSTDSDWWWYAVGAAHAHSGAIPGPDGNVVSKVELWAVCENSHALPDRHRPRCCADYALPGFGRPSTAPRDCPFTLANYSTASSSGFGSGSACEPMGWDAASRVCAAHGGRLCTVSEVTHGCGVSAGGEGCGAAEDLVWTADACPVEQMGWSMRCNATSCERENVECEFALEDVGGGDGSPSPTLANGPSCRDGERNGDEEGVDCGGSCDACVEGYYGCYHDCGTMSDGSTMDRVCKKEDGWQLQKATSIRECEALCADYAYFAIGCPSDHSAGPRLGSPLDEGMQDGFECNCCHTLEANENDSERLADEECTNDFEGTGESGLHMDEFCNGYPAGVFSSDGLALGGTCRVAVYSHPFKPGRAASAPIAMVQVVDEAAEYDSHGWYAIPDNPISLDGHLCNSESCRTCDDSRCTSSGGDCCAPGDEARTCADGWEAVEINEPHCHTYTCCDPGSTVEFEFGTGRGSGSEDRDHCSTHADCDHGYYCDDTQNCWKCDSLSSSWCDTYDHGSCCLYPLLAHCPVEDWPPLMDLCGPSNALHTPTSEYEIGYLFEDDSWRPSAKQPRFFGRLSWLLLALTAVSLWGASWAFACRAPPKAVQFLPVYPYFGIVVGRGRSFQLTGGYDGGKLDSNDNRLVLRGNAEPLACLPGRCGGFVLPDTDLPQRLRDAGVDEAVWSDHMRRLEVVQRRHARACDLGTRASAGCCFWANLPWYLPCCCSESMAWASNCYGCCECCWRCCCCCECWECCCFTCTKCCPGSAGFLGIWWHIYVFLICPFIPFAACDPFQVAMRRWLRDFNEEALQPHGITCKAFTFGQTNANGDRDIDDSMALSTLVFALNEQEATILKLEPVLQRGHHHEPICANCWAMLCNAGRVI